MSAADLEQPEPVTRDPAGELAQIGRVSLAGESRVAGQEPAEGDGFGIGEQLAGTDQYPVELDMTMPPEMNWWEARRRDTTSRLAARVVGQRSAAQTAATGTWRRSEAARTNTTTASKAWNHKSFERHHEMSSGSTPADNRIAACSA